MVLLRKSVAPASADENEPKEVEMDQAPVKESVVVSTAKVPVNPQEETQTGERIVPLREKSATLSANAGPDENS